MAEPSASRIEAARELIAKAKASGTFAATRPKTKQDEVRLLRDDIEGLRAEGATWTQVAELLNPILHAGPDTIRLAIGGMKKSGTKAKANPKAGTKLKRATNASAPRAARIKNAVAAEAPAEDEPASSSEPGSGASTASRFHKLEEKL